MNLIISGALNKKAIITAIEYPANEKIIAKLLCPSLPLSLYAGIYFWNGYAKIGNTAIKITPSIACKRMHCEN